MYFPFLMLMGYLSRRQNTHLLRKLLLPIVIILALRTFHYKETNPDFILASWMRGTSIPYASNFIEPPLLILLEKGMTSVNAILLSLDLALSAHGKLKVGETSLPPIGRGASTHVNGHATHRPDPKVARRLPVLSGLIDAIEVISQPRWIGWKDGEGNTHPKSTHSLNKSSFIKSTIFLLLRNLLLIDLFDNLLRAFPDISSPFGGSMFYSHLPPLQRYTVSTVIQLIYGSCTVLGIINTSLWMSIIGVGLLGQSPAAWPPLMDNPWASTSLHELWSKRWHQMMRRNAIVAGGIPGQWVAGRAGLVLGVFIVSGLYHDIGTYTLPGPMNLRPTLFFTLQGVGVLLEDLYRKVTGRRVGGLVGRAWTYLFVIGIGQLSGTFFYTSIYWPHLSLSCTDFAC